MIVLKAFSFGYRLGVLTMLSCVLLAFSPCWYPTLTWVLLIGAGFFSSVFLSRWTSGDPVLVKLVTTSYLIRVFLALGFFIISAWQLPIFRHLQYGNGFWRFAGDSMAYHDFALRILEAWKVGIDLHSVFGSHLPGGYSDFSLPIAVLYKALGVSPLHFTLINAWLGSLTAILSYLIARRLADRRAARIAAALVAFWPSSILWSTQLLKDTAVSVLILVTLFLVIALWQDSLGVARRGRRSVEILPWLVLVIVVIVLTHFRWYMGLILFTSVGVTMGIAFGIAVFSRKWRPALTALGLILAIGGATFVTQSIDPLRLFSPPYPEVGYVNLGVEYQRKGELGQAVTAYQRAVEINPQYVLAYRNLGMAFTEQGKMEEAARAFKSYLASETNPEERKLFQEFSARTGTSGEALKLAISKRVAEVVDELVGAIADLPVRVREVVKTVSVQDINDLRRGMISTGGHSLVDPTVAFSNLWNVLAYLPRGLAVAFLAPFPWQWFDNEGATGIFRSFSAIEVILVYLLLPAVIASCWTFLRRHWEEGWFLFIFVALTASLLALTVANLGTLFRLRLQFLLPLLIMVGIGGLPGPYRRLLGFLR